MRDTYAEERKTLFVVGSYHIGKERAFFGAARALGFKIWCHAAKKQVPHLLQITKRSKFSSYTWHQGRTGMLCRSGTSAVVVLWLWQNKHCCRAEAAELTRHFWCSRCFLHGTRGPSQTMYYVCVSTVSHAWVMLSSCTPLAPSGPSTLHTHQCCHDGHVINAYR